MSEFHLGAIIKSRRKALDISMEELCEGICSVPTLCRIENGKRLPNRSDFAMLVQRLGLGSDMILLFDGAADRNIYHQKLYIRLAVMRGDLDEARRLLKALEPDFRPKSVEDRQFLTNYRIVLYTQNYTPQDRVRLLEEVLRLTCPRYSPEQLPELATQFELTILNNIAISYHYAGQPETAIRILSHMSRLFDRGIISEEDPLLIQPAAYYNLSRFLGREGRLEECIVQCEKGIAVARRTGCVEALAQTYYNCAYALRQRQQPGDLELAKKYMAQACCVSYAMEQECFPRRLEDYQTWFGSELDFLMD